MAAAYPSCGCWKPLNSFWTSFSTHDTGWLAMGEVTGATESTNQVVLAQVEWLVDGEDLRRNHALNICQGLCTGVSRAGKCSGRCMMADQGAAGGGDSRITHQGLEGTSWVKMCSKSKHALGIWSLRRKLRGKRWGGKFFGNCCLGFLVLNQSFLFPQRGTLRQGPKIDLGMFQAFCGVASTYLTISLQKTCC